MSSTLPFLPHSGSLPAATPSDPSKRRLYQRLDTRVAVNLAGTHIVSHTRDLSVGGMFVEWNDPLAPGSLLPVTLNLPSGRLEMTAVVVRTVEGVGMGMRFESGSPRTRERLGEFLDSYFSTGLESAPRRCA